jgi:type II secretory pathway pseudopilin PulG
VIELLVVIGIIVLIMGIALPVLVSARKKAARTRMSIDLQALSQALDAYRQDFKDYPRIDYTTNNPLIANALPNVTDRLGAVTLCWALLAPGPATGAGGVVGANGSDGADGPGFRVRGSMGQVYGPYIQPDKFNISGTTDWDSTINDFHGNPYLYFPGNKGANISAANGFAAPYYPPTATAGTAAPMYNCSDNTLASVIATQLGAAPTGWPTPATWTWTTAIQTMLGDTGTGTPGSTPPDGMIDGSETPATTGPYLLWGAGPDEMWGDSDDVTNFTN